MTNIPSDKAQDIIEKIDSNMRHPYYIQDNHLICTLYFNSVNSKPHPRTIKNLRVQLAKLALLGYPIDHDL